MPSDDDGRLLLPTPVDVIDGELVDVIDGEGSWDLAHRVHALDAAFTAMNRRVQGSVRQLGDEYVHGWVALWVRWRRFLEASLQPPSQPSSRPPAVERQLRDYERSVTQWRRAAQDRGVVVTLELPSPPSPRARRSSAVASGEPGDDEGDGWAGTVAVATAITATAVAVVAVVNKLSS